MAQVRIVFNQRAIDDLAAPTGLIGREVARRARLVLDRAKQRAAVSPRGTVGNPPGYMRDHLELRDGRDEKGPFVDLVTTARSRHGFAYGTLEELRDPYIRTAVTELYGAARPVSG